MFKAYFNALRSVLGSVVMICISFSYQKANAQTESIFGIEVPPISVEGSPIRSVVILLKKDDKEYLADSLETAAFYKAFGLRPGSSFKQNIVDIAITTIQKQTEIKEASYHVYNSEYGGPLTVVVSATFLNPGEIKIIKGKKGMAVAGGMKSFPLITQGDNHKLTFILNGATGLFNEINAFYSKGPEFTQGSPIATNPAGKGTRFWGEAYVEPGIGGIVRIGKSKFYPYGAMSYLISGRNTSDIYSDGSAIYGGFERLYGGLLIPKVGRNQNINIDISAGRQFFQLNDAFLFSRISGSANAGDRGSLYLSSRTAFQFAALANVQIKNITVNGFFLEPQELSKNSQINTRYLGGSFNFNDNKNFDIGISYISVPSTKAQYGTPQGKIPMEGMYTVNPKVWLTNIAGTGAFFKSEYAYQGHSTQAMKSSGWYVGAGMLKKQWRHSPGLYYRYAYMQGDDANTTTYERFDALLTGGLGNWVQGINFRKIIGDGNLTSHRVELKGYVKKNFEVSLDYFFLQANSLSNLGSLAPISNLNAKTYGHEVTLTTRYFMGNHYMLLGVFSWAQPGAAIEKAFDDPVYDWTSLQLAMFMFF